MTAVILCHQINEDSDSDSDVPRLYIPKFDTTSISETGLCNTPD